MKLIASCVRHGAPVRLCVSALAVFAAFPVLAQSQAQGTLDEVVVTATRFAEPADALPFGVSVVTAEDIARSGVGTVNEALIKLLGVPGRLDSYGGGDYSLDLRGFGTTAASNQVVVLDGIKLNEADLGGTRLAGIAIDSVAKIEVLRGSGSVLYGQGATGGVIVITTKAGQGSERGNQASLYTAVGSYGLREARASATLASGGFSLDVSGNKREADNHRDNFKSDTDGSSVKAQWSNDWLRLGASYSRDDLETGLPGALSAAQYLANRSQTTSPNTTAKLNNTRQGVFAQAELGDWQLALDVGQRNKSLDSLSSGVSTYQYDIDANTLALRARRESAWDKTRNALTIGYDQSDWERTVSGSFGSVGTQKSEALYVQDDVTFSTKTRLSLGYRSENIKQTYRDGFSAFGSEGDQNAWELGLTQPMSDLWTVYGRVGSSFRLANIDELGFTLPGAVLSPQTSRDIEVGNRWQYADGRVELRYYRNNMRNELGYDGTVVNANSYTGYGANINFDPTLRQGIELESKHSLSKTWSLQTTLGIREAKFTEGAHTSMTVPLVANKTLAIRADWKPLPDHSINAGVVMVSSQFVDLNNQCKVPGYATVDARYAYQLRNMEFSMGVSNLLDVDYYTNAYRCTGGVTNGIYPEAGRAVTAALRVKF